MSGYSHPYLSLELPLTGLAWAGWLAQELEAEVVGAVHKGKAGPVARVRALRLEVKVAGLYTLVLAVPYTLRS